MSNWKDKAFQIFLGPGCTPDRLEAALVDAERTGAENHDCRGQANALRAENTKLKEEAEKLREDKAELVKSTELFTKAAYVYHEQNEKLRLAVQFALTLFRGMPSMGAATRRMEHALSATAKQPEPGICRDCQKAVEKLKADGYCWECFHKTRVLPASALSPPETAATNSDRASTDLHYCEFCRMRHAISPDKFCPCCGIKGPA